MFASYLCYQLIDFLLAGALVCFLGRLLRRPGAAFERRFPRLFGSPFRRWCLLLSPAVVVATLSLAWFTHEVLRSPSSRVVDPQGSAWASVKYLGLGVAFYSWFVWLPLGALWRAVRASDAVGSVVSSRGERLLGALGLAAGLGLVVDTVGIEPYRTEVVETYIGIEDWPEGAPSVHVVVIADLQSPLLTARERRIPEIVNELEPDLVLFPGDLLGQSFDASLPLESARYVTSRIHAPRGAFAVNGDVDGFVPGGVAAAVQGSEVRYLDNARVTIPGSPSVEVVGLDPTHPAVYRELVREPKEGEIRIAVVHQPRHAEEIAWASEFDLVVAGHTHGGQVVLPGYGPPITASPLPREVARGGLSETTNGVPLYISRGVGLEVGFAPPIRFRCPPEVSSLVLGPVIDDGDPDP